VQPIRSNVNLFTVKWVPLFNQVINIHFCFVVVFFCFFLLAVVCSALTFPQETFLGGYVCLSLCGSFDVRQPHLNVG